MEDIKNIIIAEFKAYREDNIDLILEKYAPEVMPRCATAGQFVKEVMIEMTSDASIFAFKLHWRKESDNASCAYNAMEKAIATIEFKYFSYDHSTAITAANDKARKQREFSIYGA